MIHDEKFGLRYLSWMRYCPDKGDGETSDLLIELYYALINAKARIKQLEADAEAPF